MGTANQISLDLAPEQMAPITQAVDDVQRNSDFLVSLTKKEKKALKIMANKSQSFVEKALEVGRNNPIMVPQFTNIERATKNVGSWKLLRSVNSDLMSLSSQYDDTMAAAGSDAYRAALDIYSYIQNAAKRNVPGAKPLLEELKPYFERSKQPDDTLPPAN